MSGIGSILLHVDAAAASVARLEITLQLAASHDARITALYGAAPDGDKSFAYSASAALSASDWGGPARDHAAARLLRRVAGVGPEVTWCDIVGDSIAHGFVAEAAYADLLVVGQQTGPAESGAAPAGFLEAAVLDSGKPTLVVPSRPRTATVGRCVLVAWNGSSQAARAVDGAMPILQRAQAVHVVSWARQQVCAPYSRIDLGQVLKRHGVVATIHRHDASPRVADELCRQAIELEADLVVMGCYGRGRLSERVFGGATRSALSGMPVPVLMAH